MPSMAIAPPPAQAPPHVGAADEEKKEIESPMPAASTSVQKKKRTDLPTMVREAAEALQKEKEEQLRRCVSTYVGDVSAQDLLLLCFSYILLYQGGKTTVCLSDRAIINGADEAFG